MWYAENIGNKVIYSQKITIDFRCIFPHSVAMGTPHGLTDMQRFKQHIQRDPLTRCWCWTGGQTFYVGLGSSQYRHVRPKRYAFESRYGPLSAHHRISRTCKSQECVNPAHLYAKLAKHLLPPRVRATMAERFWVRVDRAEGAACWHWLRAVTRDGYGYFHYGRARLAHRVAYELTHGPIPEGMQVCHQCDNPGCVRPDHLFIGTAQDNADDKVRKGRSQWVHRSPDSAYTS